MTTRRFESQLPFRQGFTLVELLVVIGIIITLISILIPVLGKVRLAAQVADTRNTISTLCSAVERYREDFRYFPGPLSDATVCAGTGTPGSVGGSGRVTMAENMFLGLCGGLPRTPGPFNYDPNLIGRGPTLMTPYMEVAIGSKIISRHDGRFTDEGNVSANDTNVPEFLDRFNDALPLLYLRARVGTSGVVSNATTPGSGNFYQYDLRQIDAYVGVNLGGKTHGLRTLGTNVAFNPAATNNAIQYLRHPQLTTEPRQKDAYILISAGKDRIYGTADDICNFGDLVQD